MVVTEQECCYEETEEWDRYCDGDFAASETREKSCGVEIKEGWNWHQITDRCTQVVEECGRGDHQGEQPQIDPHALAVKDGEEAKPEEHCIEFAAEKGERD